VAWRGMWARVRGTAASRTGHGINALEMLHSSRRRSRSSDGLCLAAAMTSVSTGDVCVGVESLGKDWRPSVGGGLARRQSVLFDK
jgi:hypothetical protein